MSPNPECNRSSALGLQRMWHHSTPDAPRRTQTGRSTDQSAREVYRAASMLMWPGVEAIVFEYAVVCAAATHGQPTGSTSFSWRRSGTAAVLDVHFPWCTRKLGQRKAMGNMSRHWPSLWWGKFLFSWTNTCGMGRTPHSIKHSQCF